MGALTPIGVFPPLRPLRNHSNSKRLNDSFFFFLKSQLYKRRKVNVVKCQSTNGITQVERITENPILSRAEAIAESTFPLIEKTDKIAVRAIGKGLPDVQDMVYNNRKVKAITVYDKIYGQYMD